MLVPTVFWQSRATAATSLSLDVALQQAISSNPELRAAQSDIEAARARMRQARALEAPELSYDVGKLGTSVSGDEHESSVRLSQALPFPGQRGRAVDVAVTDLQIAEQDAASVALRIRGDVTRAYRRLQADVTTLHALIALRETAGDITQTTTTRLEAGAGRYLDILRARLESARLGNDIVDATRTLHDDRRGLNTLLARDPEAELTVADSLSYAPLADSLATVLANARNTRPRLRAARLAVERARQTTRLVCASRLPIVGISVGLDRVPGANGPGVGGSVSLSLPFAPWTNQHARTQEATAGEDAARARLETSERNLTSVIHGAYESARSAEQQVRTFEGSLLPDAEDALRAAVRSYQFGQIDGLELFETLRTYRAAELEYVRALLTYNLSLTDLDTAE